MTPWIKLDNEIIDAHLARLDATAWKLYLCLLRHANRDSACWPSQAAIAEKTGLGERAVRNAIGRLVEAGLVIVERRPGKPITYLLTPAPSCRPPDEGPAPSCRTPRHRRAGDPGTVVPQNKNKEQEPKNKKRSSKIFDPCSMALPFPSEGFRQTWSDFCQHRQSLKCRLSELAAIRVLNKCKSWGEHDAIAAMDTSIENGWKGIFQSKSNGQATRETVPKEPPFVDTVASRKTSR